MHGIPGPVVAQAYNKEIEGQILQV